MNLVHIIDNLKDVLSTDIGKRKVYDKDVAFALGISRESLSQLKRRNHIPYEAIVYFCARKSISINWILFDQIPKSLEEQTQKYVCVKYFKEFNSSAGGGALNETGCIEYLWMDKAILEALYKTHCTKLEHLYAINVLGDSMEPTLRDKDVVVFDSSVKTIKNNHVYILNTPQGLLVKRLAQTKEGDIVLISDNAHYPRESISFAHTHEITIMGRVIGQAGVA